MKYKMKWKNYRSLVAYMIIAIAVLPMAFYLTGCGQSKKNTVFSVDDLSGKNIGVQLGTTGDIYVSDYESDGSNTVVSRFNKGADSISALKQGKIDAVVIDEQPAKAFASQNKDITILDEEFTNEDYAICVAKGSHLTNVINDALEKLKANGVIEEIIDSYIGDEQEKKEYAFKPTKAHTNGTLQVAINAYFAPYEYYMDGKIVGIDIDIITAVADELGMDVSLQDMEFDSIITAVSAGKMDVGISGITVTEERKKNIDFTNPYATSKQVVIVRDDNAQLEGESIIDKFKNDFIEESRYVYILQGLLNTILITIGASVLGVIIGFIIGIIRSKNAITGKLKILNFFCKAYLLLIRGTPSMIQLLIIYYVIFSSVNVNKLLVAILAFGINSGAYVAEIFRAGIMSVDRGQTEGARSLGLSDSQTMRYIILPQAVKNVLPALVNEFIVLLKETSISGYIGLNDLTRGGDIIRSITYDAFMPLIGVALIYLTIVFILSSLVKRLERRLRKNER